MSANVATILSFSNKAGTVRSIRRQFDITFCQQSERFQSIDGTTRSILTALLSTQTDVGQGLDDIKRALRDQTLAISQLLSPSCLALEFNAECKTSVGVVPLTKHKSRLGTWNQAFEDRIRLQVAARILDTLRFPTITAREEQIQEAYPATYVWIFKDLSAGPQPWSSFADWLRIGSGVYWMNGKAASGKSTLMRYISHHPRTENLLRVWSGKRKLRIIRFYFWNSGTIEQRSQAGLLRSLLSECFIQDPELIPVILLPLWTKYYSELISKVYVKDPDAETTWDDGRTWSDLQKTGEKLSGDWQTWTMDSLMHAFTLLLEQDTIPTKLCIFVDGLDEYDGDHHTIATLFKRVASSPYVKVCVSSRPLLPFEDAFNTGPRLRLQDLTQDDIKHYVTSKFNKNSYFQRLALEQPAQAEAIVKDIVAKADGVFLWVVLVVVSLLEGLSNRDEISYLQRRIDLMPRDLESLFTAMLSKVPALYRTSTSELFQIFHCARNYENNAIISMRLPVALDLLSLAYSTEADSESAVKAEFKAVPAGEIATICSNMEARLKVRTMGLLEVPNCCSKHDHRGREFCGAVQYLHRTVRDYLESREVKTSLLQQTHGTDFNPHNSLLRAYVRRLKGYVDFGNCPQKYFAAAMTHAYFVELETSKVEIHLLDGLKVAENNRSPILLALVYPFCFLLPSTAYALTQKRCCAMRRRCRNLKLVPHYFMLFSRKTVTGQKEVVSVSEW